MLPCPETALSFGICSCYLRFLQSHQAPLTKSVYRREELLSTAALNGQYISFLVTKVFLKVSLDSTKLHKQKNGFSSLAESSVR